MVHDVSGQPCRVCGSTSDVRLYLPGPSCPLHTPAAQAGRPEPHGEYPEPFSGARPPVPYRHDTEDRPLKHRPRKRKRSTAA